MNVLAGNMCHAQNAEDIASNDADALDLMRGAQNLFLGIMRSEGRAEVVESRVAGASKQAVQSQ
jgi:hypothetical protein